MQKIIEGFVPQGGKHCITTSLKQVFDHAGHPLSEAMLLGLGAGLDFTYLNLEASPMVAGRSKVIDFEHALAGQLGITIRVQQSKSYEKTLEQTRRMIDANAPVVAYVDMPMLTYLGMDPDSHFGGHSIVLFGYDDARRQFYVSDRDHSSAPIRTPQGLLGEDFHLVPYDEMRAARSSSHRPFPANNKFLEFDFHGYTGVTKQNLRAAIGLVCEKMLHPPAGLKGIRGMGKFAKEILKWSKFSPEKLRRAGATNYFQIHGDGGTGGGIFRNLYGTFLREASDVLASREVARIGDLYVALSARWNQVADTLWQVHETGDAAPLPGLSGVILELQHSEGGLLEQLSHLAL